MHYEHPVPGLACLPAFGIIEADDVQGGLNNADSEVFAQWIIL